MPGNIMQGDFFDTLHIVEDHLHSKSFCLPSFGAPVSLTTTASAAWGYSATAAVEIVASVDAPSAPFDIHWAVVTDISANGYYELEILQGPAGSETFIARVPFFKTAGAPGETTVPCISPRMAKNTRISCKLYGSNAAANTCKVKLGTHQY